MHRVFGPLLLLPLMSVLLPEAAPAQLPEGLSLGLTPSAERVFWGDDVELDDATFLGGRASLNFGRYVGLQGYYLADGGMDGEGTAAGSDFDAKRYGGDVVLTIADATFSPFLRVGGGVLEFEGPDGLDSEHITATLGGGVRFDLFDRLQTQVFVQDLAFRARNAAFLDGGTGEEGLADDEKTFHNLSIGAGVNVYLGGTGEGDESETDLALAERLRGGLTGLSVPVELFAGSLQFDDDLGLEDQTLAGARLGMNFGPYVGLRGYYMRGLEDDFGDVEDLYGYGGEANFNLNRGEGFTPYLIVGLGRLDVGDRQRERAGLPDEEKWTATAGAGLTFNVSDRIRLEGSARNLLLTQGDTENVTQPDELQSNWLVSGGLRFAIGGASGPDAEDLERELEEARRAEQRDRSRELREARIAGEEDDEARDAPSPEPRTVEIPVLEEGEVYIRFGESGTFERRALEVRRDSLAVEDREEEIADRLEEQLARIERRLDAMESRQRQARTDVDVNVEGGDADAAVPRAGRQAPAPRPDDEGELDREAPEGGEMPRTGSAPRGVFEGGEIELTRLGMHTGLTLHSPVQLLLGVQTDLGSAFGGSARFVPDATIGFLNDFTFNANAHIEWPLPFEVGNLEPYVAAGAGVIGGGGETQLAIPNVVLGTIYPWGNNEAFVALQGLDFFDENRLLVGLRRF
ncbi:MAG: outer membrane beta-barrel protein [Gemmatimonadota bacterium]